MSALDGRLLRCSNVFGGGTNRLWGGCRVTRQTSARTEFIRRPGMFLTRVDSVVDETDWLMIKVMRVQLSIYDEAVSATFRGWVWSPFLLSIV